MLDRLLLNGCAHVDHHFLTPLFSPKSIVVFAGPPDHLDEAPSLARAITG